MYIQDLIDRDTPKKVVPYKWRGYDYYVCSLCGNVLYKHQPFCNICGQRLDWRGDE